MKLGARWEPQIAMGQRRADRSDLGAQGFTLLELLVVIVILSLLIELVAPAVLHQLEGARVSVARQPIARMEGILDLYKLNVGSYPNTDQGLQALVQAPAGVENWNGPYLKGAVPSDPWGHPFSTAIRRTDLAMITISALTGRVIRREPRFAIRRSNSTEMRHRSILSGAGASGKPSAVQ